MKSNLTIALFIVTSATAFCQITTVQSATQTFKPSQAYIPRVMGYVDMHTHPMSHLAFGGKVLYGAPDEQAINLPGSIYKGFDLLQAECNTTNEAAGSVQRALANCNAMHGGHGAENDCGNYVRAEIVNMIEKTYIFKAKNALHTDHPHDGFPNFNSWPVQSSVTHQQMWHDWIKRAYQGGLRIMVALAVNNGLLAAAARAVPFNSTTGPGQYFDDKSSVELQLSEMRKFILRHNDFMQIARSPQEALSIVKNNKLAVILGVETDDLGNLTKRAYIEKLPTNLTHIKAEIENLYYNYDVRYIIPIHFSDNVFGGAAVTDKLFALSTKYYTNQFVEVIPQSGINVGYKHEKMIFESDLQTKLLEMHDFGWVLNNQPNYTAPPAGSGHINRKSLTGLGISSLVEMMKLGMIIDVDHMSHKSMEQAIAAARFYRGGYPLNAGHTGIRPVGGSERNLFGPFADSLTKLGGMIGIGTSNLNPDNFINNLHAAYQRSKAINIAIGTDVNGLEPLPKATGGLNSTTFYTGFSLPKSRTGNKVWDYTRDGVAHYGLMPEFLKDVKERSEKGNQAYNLLMNSADSFIQMWEKCERMNQRTR